MTKHRSDFLTFSPQVDRYRLVDASTLIVDGVGANDRGLFRCTASNIAGSTSVNSRVEITSKSHYIKLQCHSSFKY